MRYKIAFVLCYFCFVLFFSHVQTGWAFADPYVYANFVEDTLTAIHSATQIQHQLMQIQNQVQNTQTISDYQWRNNQQLIQQLDQNMQQGQALSYSLSNVNQNFKARYLDYSQSSAGQVNYATAYHRWNATTLSTLQNALSSAGMGAHSFNNEHQLLQNLLHQGQNARGRMQVLQVSTEIAAENVNQMQELRRLETEQLNAQDTYMAYQVSKDSYREANLNALEQQVNTQFPAYHNSSQLGLIPNMP